MLYNDRSVLFGIFSQFFDSDHGGLGGQSGGSVKFPGSSGHGLFAAIAFPYTYTSSLDIDFAAERAAISRMLLNLELLHDLSQTATISSTIFGGDSYFLCSLGHLY